MGAIEWRWLDGRWVVELCGGHIVFLLCALVRWLACWSLLFLEMKSEEEIGEEMREGGMS